jgi:nitrate/nitrite-specific signal transduction histidine kinase
VNIRRLKWIFLGGMASLFVVVEYSRRMLAPFLGSWQSHLIENGVILVGIVVFLAIVLRVIERLHERLQRQNQELLALHRAELDIYGDLALETVLDKVVDNARELLDARYGALSVVSEDGTIYQFFTSGIDRETQNRIGSPPVGEGLLGVVLREEQRLRIKDLTADPRAVGFPEHHPEMRSLLAVPIVCRKSPLRGNLYVAEKETADQFDELDEATLERFATMASAAVDNAHLHEQLRSLAVAEERARLAREMHDGMAQVLAYVNTKAQAVQEYLRRGRSEAAGQQLEQLAAAAREVYTDVREGISALRTPVGTADYDEALREFIKHWEVQSGIQATLAIDAGVSLGLTEELQMLRIIQEALANVRKHSGARHARIECRDNGGELVVTIEDDGTGFDLVERRRSGFPRFGLAIMRERAESIGARLAVDSSPGDGTRVRIELPRSANNA